MAALFLLWLTLWIAIARIAQACPDVCNCKDEVVDCSNKHMLEVPTLLSSNTKIFSLTANEITSLRSKDFLNVIQVNSLWLSHNKIASIERGTLTPLVQLRNLDLSYNKIVTFPWEDIQNLTSLQMLKVNNNYLVSLPRYAFANLKNLRSLRINDNKFATIEQGTFDSLHLILLLQMHNNPFTCSCKLEWLRDWIAEAKLNSITIPGAELITCEAPEQLRGALVTRIPKLDCMAPTVGITYQPDIENIELFEGFILILNCESKGSPRPDVKWEILARNQYIEFSLTTHGTKRNGRPLNTQFGDRFLVFPNGTLIISHLSKNEEGNYSCVAVNDVGKAVSSVKVEVAGTQKQTMMNTAEENFGYHQAPKTSDNNVISQPKFEEKEKNVFIGSTHVINRTEQENKVPQFTKKCGAKDGTQYISNHAFNLSSDELKQYSFDFGVIALEVSETEAKVQLNPLQLPDTKATLHVLSDSQVLETVDKEPFYLYHSAASKVPLDLLYLCTKTGNGHSVVQWSRIEEGINAYRFKGLQPGTNYTLCMTYGGADCQVQVVFSTRRKIPSLLIIVTVSIFLLVLATIPLLGATCCHLLHKYQGKTYRLIMKTQNLDQMEKHMAADFDPSASFVKSENYTVSELVDGEGDLREADEVGIEEESEEGDAEGSVATESIPVSQSKTNQEGSEVDSEYSDRLPLGAEAVNIAEEINGNYRLAGP